MGAEYFGLWGNQHPQDPACENLRMDYVIKIAGCPLTWVYKFHTEVILSTLYAKYVTLLH